MLEYVLLVTKYECGLLMGNTWAERVLHIYSCRTRTAGEQRYGLSPSSSFMGTLHETGITLYGYFGSNRP